MELVVIKLGGGLITEKSKLCTPRLDIIKSLCGVVKLIHEIGKYKVILIHGAGSFGHLKAKTWKLNLGKIVPDFNPDPGTDWMDLWSQEEAVESVRKDMQNLNRIIKENLCGVATVTLSPHMWASGTGTQFHGNLTQFYDNPCLVISHGDVVDVPGSESFGILSGDHISVRLVCEASPSVFQNVHVVFAIADADGLMTHPPWDARGVLVSEWHPSDDIGLVVHNDAVDVTGGLRLKLNCAAMMTTRSNNVWIVNGLHPERILQALSGFTKGTRISS